MTQISVVVITYNEEANLARCLASVQPFAAEIVVVDSGSTDATREIAERHGARVVVQPWLGYGPQKQFALEQARMPWVFSIDADEEVSPALAREIAALDFAAAGYTVPRLVWYMNRWIRHGGWHPDPVLRLFRREGARFTPDPVHESVHIDGRTRALRAPLYHYSYRDLAHHVAKMNVFSTLSADRMAARGRRSGWLQIAFRPSWEFFRVYVLRLGLLDGFAGFVIAVMHAQYTFLRLSKLEERNARKDSPKS
jgi:glycosyltransferase involved in cell wall biosynthesis